MRHELHVDAPPAPEGMQRKPGVEYGCGKDGCDQCYEMIKPAEDDPKKEENRELSQPPSVDNT
jgi:hypothetical protein